MCGRTACTLDPGAIRHCCGYKNSKGRRVQPKWRDPPGGQKYYPSYNTAPGAHMPVLVSNKHFEKEKSAPEAETESMETSDTEGEDCEYSVQPMQWGLTPSWSKEAKVNYNMINARSDGMLSKNTFKRPLEKGRRCVVVVDGYFEWQKKENKEKQPYFLYYPRSTATTVEEAKKEVKEESKEESKSDEASGGEPEKHLLMLAGIFDIWRPKDEGAPVYSYTIITVDSYKSMSWLHDRMPAILNGEDEVRAWLDFGSVPLKKAVELIKPTSNVQYHPVSSEVNSSKNKSEKCVEKVDLTKVKETASSKFMSAWLGKAADKKATKRKSPSPPPDTPPEVKSEPEDEGEEDEGEPTAKKAKADDDVQAA